MSTLKVTSTRAAGVCGVVFVAGLLAAAAMVSLPTASESGAYLRSFYVAHAQVVIVQQLLSVLILLPLIGFVLGLGGLLHHRQGLLLGGVLIVLAELSTNIPPLILATTDASNDTAHALTVIEDVADAALFASIAVFSAAVSIGASSWLRIVALLVAAVTLARAAATPLHLQLLEVLAPLAFLAMVLSSSVWMIAAFRRTRMA